VQSSLIAISISACYSVMQTNIQQHHVLCKIQSYMSSRHILWLVLLRCHPAPSFATLSLLATSPLNNRTSTR